ncbi:permease [Bradyrhizobium sp. LTSP885]|uniref:DUF418 domain-containing protein n=1 Tax=Bradyrhizobium sp. LTSP885 TaxID=1619232 RepID=UPI0005CB63D0|nr:DUF418 domain-containing protein [Bradyrhizobium sp. LTSP885]KJC35518.1 permease [Bradyrhizobium sp. LTSP885]
MTIVSGDAVRPSAAPTAPSSRLGSIDALRGIALFGVLAINLETEFRVSIFQQFLPRTPDQGLGGLVDRVLDIFIDMKAFALFSLLFGVGLAIQFDRLAHNDQRTRLLVRRMLVLLGFGLIHLFLIWNGDILAEYALAGLVVLPFLFAPTWLIAAGSVAFLALYLLQPVLPTIIPFPDRSWLVAHVGEANRIYATAGSSEILAYRIKEVAAFLPLHSYVFPRTLGLFLLGAACWRAGLFAAAHRSVAWLWLAAALAIAAGLSLTLAPFARAYSGPAGTLALALGYAALVLAVETTTAGARLLRWAEPVGRMAFTNYILQSVILGFVFYGYGLGLFGKLDSVTGLAIVIAVYVAQAIASRWWLQRFRYGPIEWLWRALMYGRAPKFMNAD